MDLFDLQLEQDLLAVQCSDDVGLPPLYDMSNMVDDSALSVQLLLEMLDLLLSQYLANRLIFSSDSDLLLEPPDHFSCLLLYDMSLSDAMVDVLPYNLL